MTLPRQTGPDVSEVRSRWEPTGDGVVCFHCGTECGRGGVHRAGKDFCCTGCLTVHDLLADTGLERFYELNAHPGTRIDPTRQQRWVYLDEPEVRGRLLDFSDGGVNRVTFRVPSIHCVACVWLLENLFRLHAGVRESRVNFSLKEVSITYIESEMRLSELAALLDSIGYAPALTMGALDRVAADPQRRRRILQVGVAGFAFGNIMLLSIPAYLGFDSYSGPMFRSLFGWLSLLLAAPVLVYSASDYWKSAFVSFRQRVLTLDVPIAVGLIALYGQSVFEIVSGTGEGYLDSLSGLVFFLLCGRFFQQKTYDRLAFDRDYRCFFPLSVLRKVGDAEEAVSIGRLRVGDRVLIRNRELIPADARLLEGEAFIDYSFVTGESEPVTRQVGEHLYAGGQQVGGMIEVETIKPVSDSYLTTLWDHETFRKNQPNDLNSLTNRYSRWFTAGVLAVAFGAVAFWLWQGQPGAAVTAFISVLIVACPCALALAAPFALGTARRLLGRGGFFIKNTGVLERMARIDSVVLDKTGTLTSAGPRAVRFLGKPLSEREKTWVHSLTRHSTHPLAVRIGEAMAGGRYPWKVRSFLETAGEGLEGQVSHHEIWLGSAAMLERYGATVPRLDNDPGSRVHLAIDGQFRGTFLLTAPLRAEVREMAAHLQRAYELSLVSGDNERERALFRELLGEKATLRFLQSPLEKLEFVQGQQSRQRVVMMVGDGLNDAGALRQSDVGVAVVERVGSFSPSSDVILQADRLGKLPDMLAFSKKSVRVVAISLGISAAYNLVGISIAAAAVLSPVICAILMPLSSISVVLFACGATTRAASRSGFQLDLGRAEPAERAGEPVV